MRNATLQRLFSGRLHLVYLGAGWPTTSTVLMAEGNHRHCEEKLIRCWVTEVHTANTKNISRKLPECVWPQIQLHYYSDKRGLFYRCFLHITADCAEYKLKLLRGNSILQKYEKDWFLSHSDAVDWIWRTVISSATQINKITITSLVVFT